MNIKQSLLLGSQSPRRQQLLKETGLEFKVVQIECEEVFPDSLGTEEVAEFLAIKKSKAYSKPLSNEILITADTIVTIDDQILGKPTDHNDAVRMLRQLSGSQHQVITGVTIRNEKKAFSFSSTTNVWFKNLTDAEINHYVSTYKPFDKAGAYGIQEWIGMIGVSDIEGSYYNVVGLPVCELYQKLKSFA